MRLTLLMSLAVLFISLNLHAGMPACPISLTNPDGQALSLEKYELRVAVQESLSLTEMEMVFRNPLPRQIEGRFLYLLPPGATISRFAKEVNGKLMEGEVVERMRAQSVYTQILQTMRDPALLEMDQGNRFSARVFPIPANGTVRLLLAYSQLVPSKDGERKITIPMAGMPRIGEFSFKATGRTLPGESASATVLDKTEQVGSDDLSIMARKAADFTPSKDIELNFKLAGDARPLHTIRSGNFQMLSYRMTGAKTGRLESAPTDWSFYIDTSASNSDTEQFRLSASEAVLNALVPLLREHNGLFSAYSFDLGVKELMAPISMNNKGGQPLMPQVVTAIRARHFLGATNLEAALKKMGEDARAAKKSTCFVLISDGIPTLGAREVNDLLAALGDWPAQHVLHALVIGNKQDEKVLNAIVEKTHGRVVAIPFTEELDKAVQHVVAELTEPLGDTFEVYDESAAWIYPKTFRDVRPGQEILAFSELKNGAPSKAGIVHRGFDSKVLEDIAVNVAPTEIPDFAPLLQREGYRAYLDHLEKLELAETDANKKSELHQKRIETSVKNRVLCPLTSLLVLESENDYQRFGIERTALADIMQIGKSGIELRKRAAEEIPPPVIRPGVRKRNEAFKKLAEAKAKEDDGRAADKDEKSEAPVEELARAASNARGLDEGGVAFDNPNGRGEERRMARQRELSVDRVDALEQQQAQSGEFAGRGAAPATSTVTAGVPAPTGENHAHNPVPNAPRTPPADAPAHPGLQRAQDATPAQMNALVAGGRSVQNPNDWSLQYNAMPSAEELNQLQAAVRQQPRDRTARNAYADALLRAKKWDQLQAQVFEWLPFDPENPQVYEYLGKSAANLNDHDTAMRAYMSIAEIAPNRAALLARSGWLLLSDWKCAMAQEMFKQALKNRTDDCNLYRGLALSFWLDNKYEAAAEVLEGALKKEFNARYGDTKRVMREELAYIYRAWMRKNSDQTGAIQSRAVANGVDLNWNDALRVTLCWETDGNDVDLHIIDPNSEECFYSHKQNASGLELYSDQTQGLGPEVIRTGKALPGTYHIGVNYFNAGPMGVSRGVAVIMQPRNGIVEEPVIVPFCLVPNGPPMRHLGVAKY